MRLILAAILGGAVLFVWGFVSHTMLPIGNMGLRMGSGDDGALIAAMKERFTQGEGAYFVPSMDMEGQGDPEQMAAWGVKAKAGPYAVIMYSPDGVKGDPGKMMPQLPYEFFTKVFCAFIAALLVSGISGSIMKRALFVMMMGVFAWATIQVPQWNWYHFPLDFTVGGLIDHTIGWFLGGLTIGSILKPKFD
jgi:hypothetical protein